MPSSRPEAAALVTNSAETTFNGPAAPDEKR
jgi:hypothetical protein